MNWDDLAELRAKGQKPLLPVVITTWPQPWKPHRGELFDAGVFVLTHEPGQAFHVKLLDGLRVILALDNCGQTASVARLLRKHGVTVESFHGWCACYREFTSSPAPCFDTQMQLEALSAA